MRPKDRRKIERKKTETTLDTEIKKDRKLKPRTNKIRQKVKLNREKERLTRQTERKKKERRKMIETERGVTFSDEPTRVA